MIEPRETSAPEGGLADALGSAGEPASCAVVATDAEGRILVWNPEAERLYGWSRDEAIGRKVAELAPAWADELCAALAADPGNAAMGEYEVTRKDGAVVRVAVRATPIARDREVVAIVGESIPVGSRGPIGASLAALAPGGAAHAAATLAEEWYRSFLEVSRSALSEHEMLEAAELAFQPLASALQADAVALLVRDPDGDELIARASFGWPAELRAPGRPGEGLSRRVVETGRAIVVDDVRTSPEASETLRRSPFHSYAAIPLVAGTRVVGVLHATSRARGHFDASHLAALWLVGGPLASTIERVNLLAAEMRARQRAEDSARRLAALRDLAVALAGARTFEEVARAVVDVPFSGELAAVPRGFWEWSGGELRLVAAVDDPGWPTAVPVTNYAAALEAMSTRTAYFGKAGPKEGPELDCALLPIAGDGAVHGLLALCSPALADLSSEQRGYLLSVAAQSGVAAHRAKLAAAERSALAHQRQRTARLLEAITPSPPTTIPGLSLCGHYRPADGGPVGGDWFDVLPLADGRVALAVGDVAGHGLDSVTAMLILRHALYAYAHETRSPAAMLRRLQDLITTSANRWPDLVTLTFGLYDTRTRQLVSASAGHPPWLLVRGDEVHFAPTAGAPLSPWLTLDEPVEHRVALAEGDLLVFYTDGLVEVRGESLERGFERLAVTAIERASAPLPAIRDALLEATAGPERADDLSLLLLRVGDSKTTA